MAKWTQPEWAGRPWKHPRLAKALLGVPAGVLVFVAGMQVAERQTETVDVWPAFWRGAGDFFTSPGFGGAAAVLAAYLAYSGVKNANALKIEEQRASTWAATAKVVEQGDLRGESALRLVLDLRASARTSGEAALAAHYMTVTSAKTHRWLEVSKAKLTELKDELEVLRPRVSDFQAQQQAILAGETMISMSDYQALVQEGLGLLERYKVVEQERDRLLDELADQGERIG